MNRLTYRRWSSYAAFTLSAVATGIGLCILAAILWTLISRGLDAMSTDLFTQMTPAPGSSGGLLNAIVGSLIMSGIAILIGTPVGILAGVYLNEYGTGSVIANTTRFVNDVLLSAPSIIVGLFVYTIVVVPMGHFSALAGALALAIIAIPVAVRTSEDMLRLVPRSLREASAGLGAQTWRTVGHVVLPAARSGLITGVLLAMSRISGETAPLLFTALNNQFWSSDLSKPMANLPVVIFQFAMSPYKDWQGLAWAGALLITGFILVLSIVARVINAAFGSHGTRLE
ncbi:MAG TPA: phosphate ABC transporter permease PstA [Steroidobacteraceae bacterium]|nr:phosphate ABC transporter permease PstA [Steroidobacteraceae bacterium]